MKKALRVLFALPPFIFLAVAVVYVFDIDGARQPIFDAYLSVVEALVRPVAEDFGKSFEPKPTPAPTPP
ncbi:MAG: hypothetical protein M4D85_02880 [Actinomycetota bacterium]|nr:hypothetical protein [Actinomycetota bacterium]